MGGASPSCPAGRPFAGCIEDGPGAYTKGKGGRGNEAKTVESLPVGDTADHSRRGVGGDPFRQRGQLRKLYKTAVITAGVAVSGGVGGTVSADGDRNGDGMERRPGPC